MSDREGRTPEERDAPPQGVRYRVRHTTRYIYAQPVVIAHNEARLTPRSGPRQRAPRAQLAIDPAPSVLRPQSDFFGNTVHFFTLQEPHREMTVTAMSDVVLTPAPAPVAQDTPPWESVREALRAPRDPEILDAFQFAFESPYVRYDEEVAAYAASSFPSGRPLLAAVLDLTRRIHGDFAYAPGATSVATPTADVLRERRGVCQDFAHLEIACLRALGLAARYVSGYVLSASPRGARLVGVDASHAWLSVYHPGTGWIDVDPTNDVIPDDQHVTVAWGRDYGDVSPVKGVILGGGEHAIAVTVEVTPFGP
jgi:transglutaminase-like putative cysteine protease